MPVRNEVHLWAAGYSSGYWGCPRDWGRPEAWHRGYLRGRLHGRRLARELGWFGAQSMADVGRYVLAATAAPLVAPPEVLDAAPG